MCCTHCQRTQVHETGTESQQGDQVGLQSEMDAKIIDSNAELQYRMKNHFWKILESMKNRTADAAMKVKPRKFY